MAHQATTSSNAPPGREAAEGGRDRLRPGLELAEVAGADDDAALEGGEPEAGDEELAGDHGGDHPGREHARRRA